LPKRVVDLHRNRQALAQSNQDALESRVTPKRARFDPGNAIAQAEVAQSEFSFEGVRAKQNCRWARAD